MRVREWPGFAGCIPRRRFPHVARASIASTVRCHPGRAGEHRRATPPKSARYVSRLRNSLRTGNFRLEQESAKPAADGTRTRSGPRNPLSGEQPRHRLRRAVSGNTHYRARDRRGAVILEKPFQYGAQVGRGLEVAPLMQIVSLSPGQSATTRPPLRATPRSSGHGRGAVVRALIAVDARRASELGDERNDGFAPVCPYWFSIAASAPSRRQAIPRAGRWRRLH